MSSGDVQRAAKPNWKRFALFGGAAALVLIVIGFVAFRAPPPALTAPLQARLELAAGDVLVNQGAGERGAISGLPLAAGATVSTGRGARALVRMPDGATVFLRGDSKVELDKDSLELDKGEYWLDAPPTDRRAAVHRADDTEITASEAGLSIRKSPKGVVVYVARGSATVSAKAGRVEVK